MYQPQQIMKKLIFVHSSFASVIFVNSSVGTVSDENGKFYLQADGDYTSIQVSFMGYETYSLELTEKNTFDLKIVLGNDAEALDEVMVFSGN